VPGKPFQSKYIPHLSDILKWREEGKTFEQIAALLPPSLKPNSRVIYDLVKRRTKRKNRGGDWVTIPITMPKESLRLTLQTFATILSEKMPAELRQQVDDIKTQIETISARSIEKQPRANSDKALALAAKLKVEQEEKARNAAITKPRPKLNTDRIELLPESPKDR
jgi:hypothetical protein